MKVLVVGAKGMLGKELCRVFGNCHDIVAWDIEEIDITDRDQTLAAIASERPNVIVNSAVFVDLEGCESDPDKAWRVNAMGAQNLALAAQQCDGSLVYISSDYIFDGKSNINYDEVSQPNPLNQYGRSKLAGEKLSQQACARTFIVRTAWLFGHAPNNYVERVITAANEHGVVRMTADQIESPTYSRHLADAILVLVNTSAYGCYHVTSLGACTRADFARFVLHEVGRSELVEEVDATALMRFAERPSYGVLDCRLFQLVTGQSLPDWRQGVRDYLANVK